MPNTRPRPDVRTNWLFTRVKKLFKILGPGFVTGASDDDPSGIGTYSQTGAQFGYTQLWTSLFSIPFMIVVQEMCGRIGLVTGKGIAALIRQHYNKKILTFTITLLVLANTINIGADLGAMAAAVQLLLPVAFTPTLIGITLLTSILVIVLPYKQYANILKYLTLSLFAYIGAALAVKQDWILVLKDTIVPQFSAEPAYWLNIVALLGTTISPYLFFWQADQEVEEEVAQKKLRSMGIGKPKFTIRDIRHLRVDTVLGMVFSNLICFFIIVTTASTLHAQGITTITSAPEAAAALKPFAGEFAATLFAIGIIGTGLLAVPVLAGSAAYAIAETFRWKEGLYRKFNQAKAFYVVMTLATVIGMFINYVGIQPFQLLYYTAVFNGLCAPPLLIIIMLIANNKTIMGKHHNGWWSNLGGLTITILMTLASGALVWQFLKEILGK